MNKISRLFLQLIIPSCLVSASSCCFSEEIEVDWFADIDITLSHKSNLSQAELTRDIIEDNSAELEASLISNIELTNFDTINFKLFAKHQQQELIKGLNHSSVGVQFIYRWQHSLGYFKPFFQFNTSIEHEEYDAKQRDSTLVRSQLFITKRLTDYFIIVAGLEYKQQESDEDVFDLVNHRAFVSLDFNTKNNATYYATYSYDQGDIWSSSQVTFCNGSSADDIFPLLTYSVARVWDDAFNDSLCGNWLAYKLEADTHTIMLGYNSAIGDNSSVDLSVLAIDSRADGNINYQNIVYGISYLLRF